MSRVSEASRRQPGGIPGRICHTKRSYYIRFPDVLRIGYLLRSADEIAKCSRWTSTRASGSKESVQDYNRICWYAFRLRGPGPHGTYPGGVFHAA